jgi:hypothetical protein
MEYAGKYLSLRSILTKKCTSQNFKSMLNFAEFYPLMLDQRHQCRDWLKHALHMRHHVSTCTKSAAADSTRLPFNYFPSQILGSKPSMINNHVSCPMSERYYHLNFSPHSDHMERRDCSGWSIVGLAAPGCLESRIYCETPWNIHRHCI